jgi:transketolase
MKGVSGMLQESEHEALKRKALEIRKLTIDEIGYLGVGHIGGAMSVVEVLTLLYGKWLRIDPADPKKEERDRVVLSKGHAGPALYAVLADKGYFPMEWLHTLNKGGTRLPSHCDMKLTPGIDFSTGSLGQGSSAAVGIALGQKLRKQESRTFLILGDGESQEGQVWEAAMFAAHYHLDNLIAFTDYNKQQLDGMTGDIMSIDDITTKYNGFGWHVQRVDGHCFPSINRAIERAVEEKGRPHMIVLDTLKSKGFIPGEGVLSNHNMSFSYETAKEAIAELERREGAAK